VEIICWSGSFGFGSGFMFPFFWIGILVIVVGVILYKRNSQVNTRSGTSALDILDMKFANSEIDEATYLEKKNTLLKK